MGIVTIPDRIEQIIKEKSQKRRVNAGKEKVGDHEEKQGSDHLSYYS